MECLLEYIEERAGLLLGQGERGSQRQYTFPHRTFQEYLAACHLAGRNDFCKKAVTIARENPVHWREVLTLAARRAETDRGVPVADALVHCLSFKEWSENHSPVDLDWRVAILAAEQLLEIGLAAVESDENHRVVRDRVAGWLAAILERGGLPTKERAQASLVLAKLGDPRPGVGIIETAPKRPAFLWCGANGEAVAGVGDPWQKAFPKLPVFKLGEPKDREDRAYGSFTQFDCTRITRPFLLSKYPVTVAQYQLFVEAKGYEREEFWTDAGRKWRQGRAHPDAVPDWYRDEYRKEKFPITRPRDYEPVFQTPNHPRVGVSWFEAWAFCRWLNSPEIRPHLARDWGLPEDGSGEIRLPTEAEWELAARWSRAAGQPDDRRYPWGDEKSEVDLNERCNWDKTGIGHSSAVGLFPRGNADCGAADLSGNVLEWCLTQWINPDDKAALKRYNSGVFDQDDGVNARVLRGGGWVCDDPDLLRCSFRGNGAPGGRDYNVGFRVVWVGISAR